MSDDVGQSFDPRERLVGDSEKVKTNLELQLRVDELEQQLSDEKERGERARKKVKQLLAKLNERDTRIADQGDELTKIKSELQEMTAKQRKSGSSGNLEKENGKRRSKAQTDARHSLAHEHTIMERAEIVRELEGHIIQMRANLAKSERELTELEDMKLIREAECNAEGCSLLASASSSISQSARVHQRRLSMITQQLQEKQRFAADLRQKTCELEDQLVQQRIIIEDLLRHSSCSGDEIHHSNVREAARRSAVESCVSDAGLRASAAVVAAGAAWCVAGELAEPPQRNEALQAFLGAAGSAAEVVLARPALHAAFETEPLKLSVGALGDCSSEERLQALSLFAAYAAVNGDGSGSKALRLSDIGLKCTEAIEIGNTLETCGAKLEEWEVTRCPTDENTMRTLFKHLTSHPLRQLNLSYNALGPVGASVLMSCTGDWTRHLERMSLEMNGLGDSGCSELAKALSSGLLPALESLELGWNELSAACAGATASLLEPRQRVAACAVDTMSAVTTSSSPMRLRRLGLAGNKLGSDGACTLVVAALACPEYELELDLSMNHVGTAPVNFLTDWVKKRNGGQVNVTVVLEWNIIDDALAVNQLAEVVSRCPSLTSCGRPLVRLGNNEIHELCPQDVLMQARGLVSC